MKRLRLFARMCVAIAKGPPAAWPDSNADIMVPVSLGMLKELRLALHECGDHPWSLAAIHQVIDEAPTPIEEATFKSPGTTGWSLLISQYVDLLRNAIADARAHGVRTDIVCRGRDRFDVVTYAGKAEP